MHKIRCERGLAALSFAGGDSILAISSAGSPGDPVTLVGAGIMDDRFHATDLLAGAEFHWPRDEGARAALDAREGPIACSVGSRLVLLDVRRSVLELERPILALASIEGHVFAAMGDTLLWIHQSQVKAIDLPARHLEARDGRLYVPGRGEIAVVETGRVVNRIAAPGIEPDTVSFSVAADGTCAAVCGEARDQVRVFRRRGGPVAIIDRRAIGGLHPRLCVTSHDRLVVSRSGLSLRVFDLGGRLTATISRGSSNPPSALFRGPDRWIAMYHRLGAQGDGVFLHRVPKIRSTRRHTR